MISRVTMHKMGLADYLLTGKKEDSSHLRKEKDNVIPLFGSIEQLKFAEQYCAKYKAEWKNNYEHITIGFSKEDMARLESLSQEDYKGTLKSIVNDFIKHRCSGYDVENEIIAYAEVHEPKIKFENGKERLTHIHIGISYLNALNNSKIRTAFYNNSYISDVLDKYVAGKNGLTFARKKKEREQNKDFKVQSIVNHREHFKHLVKDMNDVQDFLENYLQDNGYKYYENKADYDRETGLKYRYVETTFKTGTNKGKINNKYIVACNPEFRTKNNELRLTGGGFENVAIWKQGKYLKQLEEKSVEELEKILLDYYTERSTMIHKRRSAATKAKLEEIHRDRSYENKIIDRKKSYKYQTYQQKIFMANYGQMIENRLKGYFVGESSYYKDSFVISNKNKSINIIDKGDEILSTKETENLTEEVRIMLEIAKAKGWDLADMDIGGDDEFIEESQRQIAEILLKNESENLKDEIIEIKQERPTSLLTQLSKENQEKIEKQNASTDISIKELKLMLPAEFVLQHAVNKYKLNADDFEIIDNKINKKSNRKKAETIIDFLIEEIHVDTKTAIAMLKELFKEQKEEFVNTELEKHKKEPVEVLMDMDMPMADSEDDEKIESQNDVSHPAKPEEKEEGIPKSPKSSNLKL